MSDIVITINAAVDRAKILAAITDDLIYEVDVDNQYIPQDGSTIVKVDLATLDGAEVEAFMKVIDRSTNVFEGGCNVFKITRDDKTFDLTGSYVRDDVDTSSIFPDIANGTPLKVRFDVPRFVTNEFREIDLWYNEVFNPDDLALLAEIGITLTGDGAEFTVTNTTEFKISFSKPEGETAGYVIFNAALNEIIEP